MVLSGELGCHYDTKLSSFTDCSEAKPLTYKLLFPVTAADGINPWCIAWNVRAETPGTCFWNSKLCYSLPPPLMPSEFQLKYPSTHSEFHHAAHMVMDISWNQLLARANLDPRLSFASCCLPQELEEKERALDVVVSEQSGVLWVVHNFICIMLHYKAFSLTWPTAFMNTTLFTFNSLL